MKSQIKFIFIYTHIHTDEGNYETKRIIEKLTNRKMFRESEKLIQLINHYGGPYYYCVQKNKSKTHYCPS